MFMGSFGPVAMMGGVVDPATVSYVGSTVDSGNLTEFTFTNHATGTAAADRKTIVAVMGRDGATDWTWTSVTVGGNAATKVIDSGDTITTSLVASAIFIIDNPTGTTATIVVTPSEGIGAMAVSVWAAYGLQSSTATDTAAAFHTSSASLDLSLDVQEGGIAIGAAANNTGDEGMSWTGFTERADDNLGSSAEGGYSSADYTAATAQTPLTVGADWGGTDDAIGVSASFR